MTTDTPTAAAASATALAPALRRLYFVRFGFAVVWAAVLIAISAAGAAPDILLGVLVVVYPLVDAAAVLWQLRAGGAEDAGAGAASPHLAEWLNVVMSVVAAIALGIAAASSVGAVLAVWGVWAVLSGVTQLVTAVLRRRSGGQVPLILSGGISVLAGTGFLVQGLGGAASATGIGGYALVGGVFFLIAAIRLSVLLRRAR
ncbi:hypothetical protein [Schumannella sp. 10F1B-5-1]|uniref:hypothetical protein n=1 Tax=Schumannella sp. 10F1B-5-1 TaxID=2590780 RepID=UPI0011309BCA|nr:hypothetical protein [Schumannella sp. 10F1B-5-1]TPW71502.1 hypothetical protein FJ658_09000 [Schumannella sp. 10F1B-5-1]